MGFNGSRTFSRKQNACYKRYVNLNYSDKNQPCLNILKVLPVTNIMPHIHLSDYDSFVLLLRPDQPDMYNLTPPTTSTNTHQYIPIITNYYQLLKPTKLAMVVTWSARSPVQLPRAVPNRSKSRAVAPLHYNYHITRWTTACFLYDAVMLLWLLLSAFQLLQSLIWPCLALEKTRKA